MNTGQLVFRETGMMMGDKKIFIVFGVIGIEDEDVLNQIGKGEEQCVTIANYDIINDRIDLHVHMDMATDLPKDTRGMRVDQILCSPVWRV